MVGCCRRAAAPRQARARTCQPDDRAATPQPPRGL